MDDPGAVGKIVGFVFWGVILTLGLIKCFAIARRKTTSGLCVHSLSLVIIGLMMMMLIGVLTHFDSEGQLFAFAGKALIAFFGFILFIVSLTLAIIGLVLYRRSFAPDGTRREYRQGRKQAVWAIVLNCIFLFFFISAFVGGMNLKNRAQALASRLSAEELVVEEKNFRLTPPDGSWIEMDADTFNPDSSLLIMRGNPQIYATVIAELPGVESGFTVDQLLKVAHSNIRSIDPDAVFSAVEPCTFNGIDGLRYAADAQAGVFKGSYVSWCCVTNGYCYQVTLWASRRDKGELQVQADMVMQGFELLDPSRRSYSTGGGPFGMCGSSFFGYSIDLQDTEWMAWKNLQDTDRFADYGGVHPQGYRFCITPMVLPFEEASLDVVHDAFLKLYEYADPLPDDQVKTITVQGMEGLAYTYSNTENTCVEQLLISSNCAYLVSVWSTLELAEGLEAQADKVFASVSYSSPQGSYKTVTELPADRQAAQAQMINKVGLGYYGTGRFEEALAWFGSGFACDSTNAVYFGNMLAAHAEMNQNEEGLALLVSASPAIRQEPSVRSWEAALLAGAGRVDEADQIYAALFEGDYRDDDDFTSWTRLRADNGMWDGLDEIFTGYIGAKPDTELQIHQMDLYYGKGDYRKVADLAARFLEQGFSVDIAYWQIDALQELGLYSEALELCEQLLEKGYRTVEVYQEKAYCEYRLKWYPKSKASLEAALALNPRNETTQDWLATVSAELGEGDNSCLKDFIEPVTLPEVFADALNGELEEGFGGEFGAYYNRFWVLWQYEDGEVLKRTDVYHIKVLDNAGVTTFSSLEYDFNPVSQEIFVNRLVVRDKEGEIIGRGAVKDYYILDDDSDGLVSEDKKLVLPVPGLAAGCSIEVEVTRAYSGGPDEFYFKRHFLAAGYPVRHAAVFLGGDVKSVSTAARNGVEELKKEEGILWKNPAPYTYKWEPMQLPAERFVPCVMLGTADSTWEESARTYLESIDDRLEGGEELDARAEKLVKGCDSDEDKYTAIVNWIRSSFTYKPLEFGRDACIPDTAADTLSYRYGDCKDLSVLLKVLLEAVKVDCHLVLVNSSDDIYPDIATTDQFNHMIVCLPGIRGGLFVDPTDQEADAFLAVPQGLHEGLALVLDPASPKLTKLPALKQDSSSCTIQRTVTVQPGKPVALADQVTLHGYYAAWMRGVLKERQKVKWVEWFQSNLADFVTGLEVISVAAEHLDDTSEGLQVELTYTLDGTFPEQADSELEVPPLWVRYYLSFQNVQERKNPFRLNYPLNLELTVGIDLPEGYRLHPPALVDGDSQSRYFDWEIVDQSRFTCRLKTGQFNAPEYAAFINAVNKGIQAAHVKTAVVKD